MSRDLNGTADFERRLHDLLEEGVQRVGGRARSRLNQARHAALADAARRRGWLLPMRAAAWLRLHLLWMPAGGAVAAAVLVAFVLWPHAAPQGYPAADTNQTTVEDLDLIADRDGMDIMESGDGQFYAWAMAQTDQGERPAGAPAGRGKGHGGQNAGSDMDRNPG